MSAPVVAQRFAGRTAVVTGAGSGVGRATAVRLAPGGARVIGTDVVSHGPDAGTIVSVSSEAGLRGSAAGTACTTSKPSDGG